MLNGSDNNMKDGGGGENRREKRGMVVFRVFGCRGWGLVECAGGGDEGGG